MVDRTFPTCQITTPDPESQTLLLVAVPGAIWSHDALTHYTCTLWEAEATGLMNFRNELLPPQGLVAIPDSAFFSYTI